MSPSQIINNVRQQLKQNELAKNNARIIAHKVELTAKTNLIIKKKNFIKNTIVTH